MKSMTWLPTPGQKPRTCRHLAITLGAQCKTASISFGGRAGSVFIPNAFNVDLVEEYDPATNQWLLRTPTPTPRSAGAWGVHRGRIYVASGDIRHRDYWGAYTAVESFDPESNKWTRHAPMPMPRHGLAGDFLGNGFHLVSGSVPSVQMCRG